MTEKRTSSKSTKNTKFNRYEPNPFKLLPLAFQAIKPNLLNYIVSILIPFILSVLIIGLVGGVILASQIEDTGIGSLLQPQVVLMVVLLSTVVMLVFMALAPAPALVLLASVREKTISGVEAVKKAPYYSLRYISIFLRFLLELIVPLVIAVGSLLALVLGGEDPNALVLLVVFISGLWLVIRILQLLPVFLLAPFVLLDEDSTAKAAVDKARPLASGRVIDILGVFAALGIVNTIIQILPLGGLEGLLLMAFSVATAPVLALRYIQFRKNSKAVSITRLNLGVILAYIVVASLAAPMMNEDDASGNNNLIPGVEQGQEEHSQEETLEQILQELSQ